MKLKLVLLVTLCSLFCFGQDFILVKRCCDGYQVEPLCESMWTRLKFASDIKLEMIPRIMAAKLQCLGVGVRVDIVTPCQIDLFASTCNFDNAQTGVEWAVGNFVKLPSEYINSSAVLINPCGRCVGFLHFTNESGRPFNVAAALKRMSYVH